MAENKKGFILYANWWFWLEDLSIQQKAEWVEWLFNYVNDKKPEMPKDQALKIVCKMTKAQLKEDLEKWQDIREKRIEAGKKGGLATQSKNKQNQANALSDKPNQAVNDNVNVNVNVNDIVYDKSHTNNNACACEESAINSLQALIRDLEQLFGRCLTMKELAQIELLNKKYSSEAILNEVKGNIDKDNPIAYICKTLSNIKKQDNRTELEKEMEEDEWLKGFYERNR